MKPIIAVPATLALIGHAWRKRSLTPAGLATATLTAVAHAYHPWNLPFVLLVVFFLAGTRATRVKENVKGTLTIHSKGTPPGEGPRTHVQVLANSLMGSILSVLHARQLRSRAAAYAALDAPKPEGTTCFSWGGDLLVIGIIANYAAVAADTLSSELGILAKSEPRLITSLTLRKVPRGTNGGVTLLGLAAGLFGSMIIVTAAMLFLPMCGPETASTLGSGAPWLMQQRRALMGFLVIWGAMGSLLDSFLGAMFQQSVKDIRSGKIVEGEGGARALASASLDPVACGPRKRAGVGEAVHTDRGSKAAEKSDTSALDEEVSDSRYNPENKHRKPSFGDERPSRIVESGWDILDNNDVNFIMASVMSIGGMAVVGWYWGVPIQSVVKP